MSAKFKAVDDIKKLGKFLSGISEFASELEKVGSLEQAANEAERRIEQLKKEEAKAIAELDKVSSELSKARASVESMIEEAKKSAELIESSGKAKANAMVEEANAHVAAISNNAREEVASAKAEISLLNNEKNGIAREIEMKHSVLKELNSKMDELKRKLG